MTEQTTTTAASTSHHAATEAALQREIDGAPLFVRALMRTDRDKRTRWAAYGLPPVPPLTSFPDYTAAADKRRDIALARTASEKELRKAITAISRGMAALRDDETDRQARDIIAGRSEEAFEGFEELKAQVARLTQRVKAYNEALRMQDEAVATIRSERSIDAAEVVAPAHREAVAGIADAIAQLRTALDREEAARAVATQAGYDGRLPNFAVHGIFGQSSQLDDTERRAREYVR